MVINVEDEAANEVATTSKLSLTNDDDSNKIAKAEGNNDAEATNSNNDSELILIQDNAFTIKIQVPSLEPFELQV